MNKKWKKGLIGGALLYSAYVLGSGVLYPKLKMKQRLNDKQEPTMKTIMPITETNERVTVRFDCLEALALRLELIDQAQDSIDFTQYSIFDDVSGDLFAHHLLHAADRGVKVRLILPGMIMKWKGKSAFKKLALAKHPNISFKVWGGVDFIRPWQMNNVLHDKIFIVDRKYFISAGRNVGNRFMLASFPDEQAYDLDLIVDANGEKTPLLDEVQHYFESLWHHPCAKLIRIKKEENGKERQKWRQAVNWQSREAILPRNVLNQLPFVPIERCGLIHNSLNAVVKAPYIWESITYLVQQAEHIRLQTPYLVLTSEMSYYMRDWQPEKVTLLTNSLAVTPNLLAFAGYLSQKVHDLSQMTIFEYQGTGSVHNKSFVTGDIVGVGSFNLDPRSVYLDTENMIVVQSQPLAQQMNAIMDHFQAQSLQAIGKFSYSPSAVIEQRPVKVVKKKVTMLAGWLTKPFRHIT